MSQSFPPLTFSHLNRLQRAAAYDTFLNQLRSAGLRMVYVGAFFCCLMFLSLDYPFGFLPFLLVGLWLVSYGVAIYRSPVLQRPIIFDRAFIAIGLLNAGLLLYETLMVPPAPGQIARSSIGLPIQAVIWFAFPWLYKRSLRQLPAAPDEESLRWLRQLVQDIRQNDPRAHAGIIAFSVEHQGRHHGYKGLLETDIGIVIGDRGNEVGVFAKRDLQIAARSQTDTRKKQIPVDIWTFADRDERSR